MPRARYIKGGIKGATFQAAITDEANTDAGATWGAPESTLANSLKTKLNSALAALRAANIIRVSGGGKIYHVAGIKGSFALANITDEATANSDAVYDAAEAALLNSMKAKVNLIITAMTNARIIGGHTRFITLIGRKASVTQPTIAPITIADGDATYTSGGAGEQGLTNDIKLKLNLILAALRAARILGT